MQTTKRLTITGLAVAGALTAALTAAALPAVADTASTTATAGSTTTAPADPTKGGHQANGITEALLTGDTAAKVSAAVTAANPGATIQRMENDAEGAVYEAHIVKADGTRATVKLDASFAITGTETGGPGGGRGAADGTSTGSSTSNG